MADMTRIVTAVIAITVSVIVLASVLAPTIAEYTGESGALADYTAILSAVMLMAITALVQSIRGLCGHPHGSGQTYHKQELILFVCHSALAS